MKENESVVLMKEYSNNTLLYGDINLLIVLFYYRLSESPSPRSLPSWTRREEEPPRISGKRRSTPQRISEPRLPKPRDLDSPNSKLRPRPLELERKPPTSDSESTLYVTINLKNLISTYKPGKKLGHVRYVKINLRLDLCYINIFWQTKAGARKSQILNIKIGIKIPLKMVKLMRRWWTDFGKKLPSDGIVW